MSGQGPAPKDPSKRARRNKDVVQIRTVVAVRADQPDLPPRFKPKGDEDGTWRDEIDWPVATVRWWQMWRESPLSADFTPNDWSVLMDTAVIHAEFWEGNTKLAPELRLREAKFGATPEDRLRLRIQFAQAVDAELTTAKKVSSARDRFRGIAPASGDSDVSLASGE